MTSWLVLLWFLTLIPFCPSPYRSFGVVLQVVALELDELIEAEAAERLSLARVLPSRPR